MQKPEPILIADRFPALLNSLLALLEGLSPDEWARPTAAAAWSVKDVALHLLGDEIGILSGKRDAFSEPQAGMDVWENLVAFINRRNAEWVQAAGRISPRLLCELLRFTGEQSNALFAVLDPHAQGGAVSWAGSTPAPVWLDIAREFTERWHHQQHIRDATGKPGCTEPYFLAPVLAAFVYALPRTYRQVSAAPGTAISLRITGESGGVWTVLREEAGWQLYLGEADRPQAGIILPEDTAWRLFTKGLSAADARDSAVLHGNLALAEKALETIAIIG